MNKKLVIIIFGAVLILGAAFWFYFDSDGEVKSGVEGLGDVTDYGYVDVSVEEAKVLMEEIVGLRIVDVSPYYEEGHILDAVWYELGDGTLDLMIEGLNKNASYLVYCHGDGPSIEASRKLVDAGFSNVYRLEGNFGAWVDAGELVVF